MKWLIHNSVHINHFSHYAILLIVIALARRPQPCSNLAEIRDVDLSIISAKNERADEIHGSRETWCTHDMRSSRIA